MCNGPVVQIATGRDATIASRNACCGSDAMPIRQSQTQEINAELSSPSQFSCALARTCIHKATLQVIPCARIASNTVI